MDRCGGKTVDREIKVRMEEERKNHRTEEVDGDERQWEQLRAPGSRPGPTPAFLEASPGLSVPICKTGMGHKLHSPLLLCWSGGEVAGRENRSNDGGGPALGPALPLPWQWRAPQLPQSQPHALASKHAPDGPSTVKASLSATSYLECPPSCHLVTSYVIFKAQLTPQKSEGSEWGESC